MKSTETKMTEEKKRKHGREWRVQSNTLSSHYKMQILHFHTASFTADWVQSNLSVEFDICNSSPLLLAFVTIFSLRIGPRVARDLIFFVIYITILLFMFICMYFML